jgi:hypothetical protein
MLRPAARFLIAPRPPDFFAARFLAAVILPPLLFFAILNYLLDLFSPTPLVESSPALPVNSLSLPLPQKSPFTSHAHSAEQVHDQQDDHDQPDNPYPSARAPSPISVIASAAPEQQHKHKN